MMQDPESKTCPKCTSSLAFYHSTLFSIRFFECARCGFLFSEGEALKP
jgi:ribosomal protein S27AE